MRRGGYDGQPVRTAYERLAGIVQSLVRRSKQMREVKPAPTVLAGAIEVLDPDDGHAHSFVPTSAYVDALRTASEEQTRLRHLLADVAASAQSAYATANKEKPSP